MNAPTFHEPAFYDLASPDIGAFGALVDTTLDPSDVPHAVAVEKNIPVYDAEALAPTFDDPFARRALMGEWARVIGELSGVLVIRAAQPDASVLDAATAVFEAVIAREKAASVGGGDHFAAAGSNDRIWNSLGKLAAADAALFARYHGLPCFDAVAEAWLGPGYQMTAQVNVVRPGGTAQTAHRDYHLGFMSAEAAARFPAHAHHLTPALTLQGGIAHVDTPVEAGPTKLLPFSQTYGPGYLAYQKEEFRALFEERAVQVPLAKGDALFFNPALFHAAGANRTADVQRMVNLFQVSSAFGRAMESVDRDSLVLALYPAIRRLIDAGELRPAQVRAAVATAAEGYAFPTNLDTDPPIGGLAPETPAALFMRALETGMSETDFAAALEERAARRPA